MSSAVRYPAVGVFADRDGAERAVADLRRAGFREEEVGVLARTPEVERQEGRRADCSTAHAAEGAGVGVLVGASLGGLTAGAGAVPGAAAGGLAGVAGAGALGGVVGALIGLGVPEAEARYYRQELEAGRTLVAVQADGGYEQACAILRPHGGRVGESPLGNAGPGRLS
jgi:hypothetical protein